MTYRIYASGPFGTDRIKPEDYGKKGIASEEEVLEIISLLDREVYNRVLVIQHHIEDNYDEPLFYKDLEPKQKISRR